jgi:hypothetical protein
MILYDCACYGVVSGADTVKSYTQISLQNPEKSGQPAIETSSIGGSSMVADVVEFMCGVRYYNKKPCAFTAMAA